MLSNTEAAKEIGISPELLRYHARNGHIKFQQLGDRYFYVEKEVEKMKEFFLKKTK